MSISDGMHTIAEFRIVGLGGTRGIGLHRLQFATEVDIQGTGAKPILVSNLTCFAYAGPSTDMVRPLGRASVETSWFTQTSDYARREGLSVFVDLTSEQLEALEKVRDGRSLIFRLDFHAIVQSQERGPLRGFQQATYAANLSTWCKLLKELEYMDVLLLAVELPIDVPKNLRGSVEEFRNAITDHISGRHGGVVARGRIVMEAIDAVFGQSQKRNALIQAFFTREGAEAMSKRDRADLVRLALRHYTNLAHHTDSQGAIGTFSRQDALFVLAGVAAALWDAIGKQRGAV